MNILIITDRNNFYRTELDFEHVAKILNGDITIDDVEDLQKKQKSRGTPDVIIDMPDSLVIFQEWNEHPPFNYDQRFFPGETQVGKYKIWRIDTTEQ